MVIADGKLVTANEERNADLLWALRGGGPGFFGVVTRYFLSVYPAPRVIRSSSYYYPLERLEEVGEWAAGVAAKLPKEVEFLIFLAAAPPALAERCKSSNGFVGVLSATAFVDSERDAAAALEALESCSVINECLGKELNQPTTLEALLEMGGKLWPEHHRYLADTLWLNSSPASLLRTLCEHFMRVPSPRALALCVLSTGRDGGVRPIPDAAFSMTAGALVLCYAIWEREEDDTANAAWHREAISALDRFAVGHYVAESDIVADPSRAERSFAKANWERLQSLRQKYDPDGLFHGHFTAPSR